MHRYLGKKSSILVFTLPFLILYTRILVYPIGQTFVRSFSDWDGITEPVFTGLQNYRDLLQDSDFPIAVRNGIIFALVLFVYHQGMGTILALIFNTRSLKIRGSRFFRTSFFIPVMLSSTVVGQLWVQSLSYNHGRINSILGSLSESLRIPFLSDPNLAIYSVAFANAWQGMGITFVFLLTAIRSIPEQYYEAAMIDGATSLQAHRKITLPLLQETYKVTFVMSLTGGLRAFDTMFVMTGGGPGNATTTLSYMMYNAAFKRGQFGYGCASAVVLLAECLVLTVFINKVMGKERIIY